MAIAMAVATIVALTLSLTTPTVQASNALVDTYVDMTIVYTAPIKHETRNEDGEVTNTYYTNTYAEQKTKYTKELEATFPAENAAGQKLINDAMKGVESLLPGKEFRGETDTQEIPTEESQEENNTGAETEEVAKTPLNKFDINKDNQFDAKEVAEMMAKRNCIKTGGLNLEKDGSLNPDHAKANYTGVPWTGAISKEEEARELQLANIRLQRQNTALAGAQKQAQAKTAAVNMQTAADAVSKSNAENTSSGGGGGKTLK